MLSAILLMKCVADCHVNLTDNRVSEADTVCFYWYGGGKTLDAVIAIELQIITLSGDNRCQQSVKLHQQTNLLMSILLHNQLLESSKREDTPRQEA